MSARSCCMKLYILYTHYINTGGNPGDLIDFINRAEVYSLIQQLQISKPLEVNTRFYLSMIRPLSI